MDGKSTGQFLKWDSSSPANLPIAQGFKSVPGVLNLVFIQKKASKEGVACLWVVGGHEVLACLQHCVYFFP
jgi:hypothetical protein